MNSTILRKAGLVVALAALLGGCANLSNREQKALSGAGIGAGLGAVAGALTGGSWVAGGLIGGGLGAAVGALSSKD
jgi:osmotically inducible lipoprotein OsmB